MSGVAGIYNYDQRPIDRSALEGLVKRLGRRGPDGSGVWVDGCVGFGHCMLWTTPESLTEKLPRLNRRGDLAITADARVDNRDELCGILGLADRVELSDSELILAAYDAWGENCPEKIIGDFAFAIWDSRKRALFAARDRMGIKPFYYVHRDGRGFVFASEITPMFEAVGVEKRIDREAIRELLYMLQLPYDGTMFHGIYRLPRASALTVRNGALTVRRYWTPASIQPRRDVRLEEDAEEFRRLFRQAVKAQMRSAYPIGCFLSGGLDSSTIMCVAAELVECKSKLTGFSMVFDKLPCDEREYIEQVTNAVGVESVYTVADQKPVGGWDDLGRYFADYPDWPIQETPSQVFRPLLDRARDMGIRSILTGLGGDQVAQGSSLYLSGMLSSFRFIPLVEQWWQHGFSRQAVVNWTIVPIIPEFIMAPWRRLRRGEVRKKTYNVSRNSFASAAAWDDACAVVDPVTSVCLDGWWDTLAQQGGVELRHPFFEGRLVEFLLSLPPEEKCYNRIRKLVLREAAKGILPERVCNRKDKAEFSSLADMTLEIMQFDWRRSALMREGVIEREWAERCFDRASSGKMRSLGLRRLANAEAWYRSHCITEFQ